MDLYSKGSNSPPLLRAEKNLENKSTMFARVNQNENMLNNRFCPDGF